MKRIQFLNSIKFLLLFALSSCVNLSSKPSNNSDYKLIIGNTIKLDKFEVAQFDFPEDMKWNDAKIACTKLGKGWRLPTKDELNIIDQNKVKIGGDWSGGYWSSTEVNYDVARYHYFSISAEVGSSEKTKKFYRMKIRAIRAY